MPQEKTPATPLPKGYRPPNSTPIQVGDGDDWAKIAAKSKTDAGTLIEFNFKTRDPGEVNYYLRVNVGCNKATPDGRNWMFSSSAKPGVIYVPLVPANLGSQSGAVMLTVPHFPGTKAQSCWHDAARMLYQYKHRADISPLDSKYLANAGIAPNDFILLANKLGLWPIPAPPATITVHYLGEALSKYGPLWAAGTWNGVNHVIVVTGVDSNGNVFVNDPAFATPQSRTIAWFDQRLYRSETLKNSLMYLP